MMINKEFIKSLLREIDMMADNLLNNLDSHRKEIESLKIENDLLKNNYKEINHKIEQYLLELEQLRKYHVNSNNNIK